MITFLARILPTFTAEPALVGELIEIENFTRVDNGMITARLMGDSEYIRNNTDGRVYLSIADYTTVI